MHEFRHFDAIGFTEKELGYSIFERMKAIARIRTELDKTNISIPIHIFGSLDTVSTPLYFLSGADIFDGLTWLRYSYTEAGALYLRNASALSHGILENDSDIPPKIWAENYITLLKLETKMKRYLREKKFAVFGKGRTRASFFEDAIGSLYAELEV